MYCNRCGAEIRDDSRFCNRCGVAVAGVYPPGVVRPLVRPRAGRKVAGVCLAIAQHFGIDVTVVRILWVLSIFLWLGGIVAYVVGWILIPEEPVAMLAAPPVSTPPVSQTPPDTNIAS